MVLLELVDGRTLDVAGNPDHATDHRHEDYVALFQAPVGGIVAVQQDVVHVNHIDQLIAMTHLDVAQAADLADPARRHPRIGNPRQSADLVAAGLNDVAGHGHVDGAQLAHRHVDLNPGHFGGFGFDQLFGLLKGEAGDLSRSDLRHLDHALAINDRVQDGVDAPPQQDIDFVARTDDVVIAHRHIGHR